MAWRSSGSTNKELVDNMKRFRIFTSEDVERGFRNVDRKHFVPEGMEDVAYADQPLKKGPVHLSAPHIYGSVLEELELESDSSLSFLNIGSGSGYLSCIVAEILGPKGVNYGVEIYHDVVAHSEKAIQKWKSSRAGETTNAESVSIHIIHGNGLCIDLGKGESTVGYDRIYVGAALSRSDLYKVKGLLAPGGILVGPVEEELLKISRSTLLPNSGSHTNNKELDSEGEFSEQVLSGVRFASLLRSPDITTVLPSRVWSPNLQKVYPESFQAASMQLLLCSNSKLVQPPPQFKGPEDRLNTASMLPRVLWLEILSYTTRKWFEPSRNEVSCLRKMLSDEKKKVRKAQEALVRAEKARRILERERDLFRLLSRRWEARYQYSIRSQSEGSSNNDETLNESASRDMETLVREMMESEFDEHADASPDDDDDDDEMEDVDEQRGNSDYSEDESNLSDEDEASQEHSNSESSIMQIPSPSNIFSFQARTVSMGGEGDV